MGIFPIGLFVSGRLYAIDKKTLWSFGGIPFHPALYDYLGSVSFWTVGLRIFHELAQVGSSQGKRVHRIRELSQSVWKCQVLELLSCHMEVRRYGDSRNHHHRLGGSDGSTFREI